MFRSEKSKISNDIDHITVSYGFHLIKGEHKHPMEDYVVAETRKIGEQEIGLFAIFDGYECHEIPAYLQSHLFNNIMTVPDFFFSMTSAVIGAYLITDTFILEQSNSNHGFKDLSSSTAVTANSSEPSWPAEVGSS